MHLRDINSIGLVHQGPKQNHPAPLLQDFGLHNFVAATPELIWLHALVWRCASEAPPRPGACGSATQKPFSGLVRAGSDPAELTVTWS